MSDSRVRETLLRDLYAFEDEDNIVGSKRDIIYPSTILDQVFDQLTPDNKSLRQILADLRQEIATGGIGNITFPVTSVNGMTGDVQIIAEDIGLGNVDNTRDADKPLSDPQREALMQILKVYDFNVDLSDLYAHIQDTDNPHAVTLASLNKDGELEAYIGSLIAKHNLGTTSNIHQDIRRSLSNLWITVDEYDKKVQKQFKELSNQFEVHASDPTAHYELIEGKEDVANRIQSLFDYSVVDSFHYPSARAVSEWVNYRFDEFEKLIPDIDDWIDDALVVSSRTYLPAPNASLIHKLYFIQVGERSISEVARCSKVENTEDEYRWDITEIGGYSKFNPNHFFNNNDGLSLNTSSIVDEILHRGILQEEIRQVLSEWTSKDHYTKEEIDAKHYISKLTILPGTMDGTIRFYTNGDITTMSSDVRVAGLQRLAFVEYVHGNDIWDNSIESRHIINKAIHARHLADKAISARAIACSPGHIIGNIDDGEGYGHEVSFEEFIDRNHIAVDIGDITASEVEDMWNSIEI